MNNKNMKARRYVGTMCGVGLGLLSTVVWVLTFKPHGGIDLSRYAFPLSRPILEPIYPAQSIPVPIWYGAGFLQWMVIGALVDILWRLRRGGNLEGQ